ncbi:hypothetical protein P7C73_g2892, partial [Tremellales sp. Uapishka_1]
MSSSMVQLPSGPMPLVGMGLWKLSPVSAPLTIYQAIQAGYRLFDGAADYGNEREAGEGIKRAIADGLVTRDELFIVSKLWNTFHGEDKVEEACRRSLSDWGLDYFDAYLIHFPIALKYVDPKVRYPPGWSFADDGNIAVERSPLHLTWKAMEQLVDLKLVKTIGISNFSGSLIMDLMTYSHIKPSILQVEMHPYHVQKDLIELCKAFGIHLMAFCSFGPQSWIELNDPKVKLVGSLLSLDTIVNIANAHSKSPAQVLLMWATQRNVTVIPKSSNEERSKENLNSLDFILSADEIERISSLDKGFRFNQPAGIDARISIFA